MAESEFLHNLSGFSLSLHCIGLEQVWSKKKKNSSSLKQSGFKKRRIKIRIKMRIKVVIYWLDFLKSVTSYLEIKRRKHGVWIALKIHFNSPAQYSFLVREFGNCESKNLEQDARDYAPSLFQLLVHELVSGNDSPV